MVLQNDILLLFQHMTDVNGQHDIEELTLERLVSSVFKELLFENYLCRNIGGLAQLARALAWHARGHRFDSGILH